MDEHELELVPLLWFAGWLLAALALFWAALKIPVDVRLVGWWRGLLAAGVIVAAVAVAVLANVALVLHDGHLDLTREKIYTPSAAATRVIDALDREVSVTYFYHSRDPAGQRSRDILRVLERRNHRLKLRAVDPDKEPTLARTGGIRIYNAAIIEAEARRVLVQSTDDAEIALGIQRVLRDRVITVCFIEGHGELPSDNLEFHTHLEGVASHSHSDASSQMIEMPGHGAGRFRRALEAQGYEVRKLVTALRAHIPQECTVVAYASPRTGFLPAESAALRSYLEDGGSALFLFDLGFELEPGLSRLIADLGVRFEQEVVIDPLLHYQSDPEIVAVTGYDPHPITRSISLTFFPGVRPLSILDPPATVRATPLLTSSRDSYTRSVEPVRSVATPSLAGAKSAQVPPVAGPRVLGAAAEGVLEGGRRPLRVIAIGDGDFASNSFFPYMANSELLVSIVRWLSREDRGPMVASRVAVPPLILFTATQARVIFVLVVLLLPFAVVALGCIVWWRRR
jgi:hypothetical protein